MKIQFHTYFQPSLIIKNFMDVSRYAFKLTIYTYDNNVCTKFNEIHLIIGIFVFV